MGERVHQEDETKLKATVKQKEKDRTISNTVDVDGSGVTQPISATALPLPTSAATSAKQLADDHNVTVSNQISSFATSAKQLADGHNVTVDNAIGASAVPIKDGGNTITVDGTVIVTDIAAIKTALEKIDNQEDPITYVRVQKATSDGDIIAAPGEGYKLRIHHIYVNNAGANVTIFHIEDGTTMKWSYCLAANGGGFPQNLKRPWDLTENQALHYDYVSGAAAVIYITIGYETIAV